MKQKTKVKSKVSSKVVLVGIIIATAIGLSLVIASLVTPAGTGNFYSGSSDTTLPPPKPICPEGDYTTENGDIYKYYCELESKDRYCDVSVDEYRCSNNNEVCCKDKVTTTTKCPPNTSECGTSCCNTQQFCNSKWGKKYCDNTTCPAGKIKYNCGKDRAACCDPEDTCGTKNIKILGIGATISICVPPNPPNGCDPNSLSYCGKTDNEKNVCCGEGTKCKNDSDTRGVPVCIPQECKEGERLCVGDLGYKLCCNGYCYRQGPDDDDNGQPDLPGCIPK